MAQTNQSNTLRAGVIGLGAIGGGVAVSLARRKRALTVYDVRRDASDNLEGVPAVAASPAAVAQVADVLMIAVVNAQQVRDVLCAPEGVLAGAHPGLVLVLLSTVALDDLKELAALAGKARVSLLDCGVTGGPQSAPRGELIAMLGGDDATVERIRPVLNDWSEFVQHMGPLGSGMAAKIARNVLHYQVWRAGHEAALLASRAGVDLSKFVDVVERAAKKPGASPTVWMTKETLNPPATWESSQLQARTHVLELLKKDLEAAFALGASVGVSLPSARAAYEGGEATLGLTKVSESVRAGIARTPEL